MTLPRFPIRTLMIVVAAMALVLATGPTCLRLARLSLKYRARASEWHRKAVIASLHVYGVKMYGPSDVEGTRQVELYLRQLDHGNAMHAKYMHAAAHPWRLVAPDPPEPK